jgi:outer membrane protein assembly factor BamA
MGSLDWDCLWDSIYETNHPGDLFSGTAIGKGLDGLKKLYQSKGYVNFGAIPQLQMDEVHHTVTLIPDIREGKPTAG